MTFHHLHFMHLLDIQLWVGCCFPVESDFVGELYLCHRRPFIFYYEKHETFGSPFRFLLAALGSNFIRGYTLLLNV